MNIKFFLLSGMANNKKGVNKFKITNIAPDNHHRIFYMSYNHKIILNLKLKLLCGFSNTFSNFYNRSVIFLTAYCI